METRSLERQGHEIRLHGVCQGLEGEAEAVVDAIEAQDPGIVALALDPELAPRIGELGPTEDHGPEDQAYVRGLSEWGAVELPPPEFREAIAAAERVGARVEGVDMTEDAYMDAYLEEVGVLELTSRAVRTRWMRVWPPKADAPEAFCRAFDERLNQGPFGDVERQREQAMAQRIATLAEDAPVAYVVEIARLEGVTQALRSRLSTHDPVRSG